MELNSSQQDILYGMILGDAYLQKTGARNARLRVEHSLKQKEYVEWKYQELEHIFQSKPQCVQRIHPLTRRAYGYVRLQSYASEFFGSLRNRFYQDNKKIVPIELEELFQNPLTIAVWYMDDGYHDKRDKSAHIYLQAFDVSEIQRIIDAFRTYLGIECKAYCRPDRQACQLNFHNVHKDKLLALIEPHLIKSMRYKLPLDPVTTDPKSIQTLVR
ncbi:MAG: hypothetical protein ACRD4B_07535 [Acidobacteriota bacterium]